MQPPKENGGSVTVRMAPGATVTGRLVDAEGKPRASSELSIAFRRKDRAVSWERYPHLSMRTDKEGRFRFTALLPGPEFRLYDDNGVAPCGVLQAGQILDMGNVLVFHDNALRVYRLA